MEQAIEYCNSEQVGAWKGTDGAMDWVRNFIVRILNNESASREQELSASDLDWRKALLKARKIDSTNANDSENDDNNNNEESPDRDDESVVDLEMYATMFETAMEMLEDSGDLTRK